MSSIPGASRYERIPTRQRAQLFWIGVMCVGAGYELWKMTMQRIQPRREEHLFKLVREKFGDDLPDELMRPVIAQKEAQEALSLQQMLDTPTPGELSGALQHELDPRKIKNLRSRNAN